MLLNQISYQEPSPRAQRTRPKVVPLRSNFARQPLEPGVGRPRLVLRVAAELINRAVPLVLFWPVFVLAQLLTGGQTYVAGSCLVIVVAWHLCCDGSPHKPSLGKRWCFIRVVAADGRSACSLWQKALRRLGTACGQFLYCLLLLRALSSGIAAAQAEALTQSLLIPLGWLGYHPSPAALLMLLAMALDSLTFTFAALSSNGRTFWDWLAGTRVITKAAHKSAVAK